MDKNYHYQLGGSINHLAIEWSGEKFDSPVFPVYYGRLFPLALSGRNAKTGEKFLDTPIAVFYESGGKRHLETRNPRYVTNAFLELCDHYYIGIPRHFGSKPTPEILKQRPRVI